MMTAVRAWISERYHVLSKVVYTLCMRQTAYLIENNSVALLTS